MQEAETTELPAGPSLRNVIAVLLIFGGPGSVAIAGKAGALPEGWTGPLALGAFLVCGAIAFGCCRGAPKA